MLHSWWLSMANKAEADPGRWWKGREGYSQPVSPGWTVELSFVPTTLLPHRRMTHRHQLISWR